MPSRRRGRALRRRYGRASDPNRPTIPAPYVPIAEEVGRDRFRRLLAEMRYERRRRPFEELLKETG